MDVAQSTSVSLLVFSRVNWIREGKEAQEGGSAASHRAENPQITRNDLKNTTIVKTKHLQTRKTVSQGLLNQFGIQYTSTCMRVFSSSFPPYLLRLRILISLTGPDKKISERLISVRDNPS